MIDATTEAGMLCDWCGDRHGVDQLCQRAQRGMSRRSFCFLFGAGVAALVAGADLGYVELYDHRWVGGRPRFVRITEELLTQSAVNAEEYFRELLRPRPRIVAHIAGRTVAFNVTSADWPTNTFTGYFDE